MLGDERLGSGTSGNHRHHWCLNLKESEVIVELTNVLDDLGPLLAVSVDDSWIGHLPGDEVVLNSFVGDQVNVALTEAKFLVLETLHG